MEYDSIIFMNPDIKLKLETIKHVLFDFDGTLSVLRRGWEDVMQPVMVEAICGKEKPTPTIEEEVHNFIDQSTGILTIRQMEWLSDAVARHGLSGPPLSPFEYKQRYLNRLMTTVNKRIELVRNGEIEPDHMMIKGARLFIEGLARAGKILYLASGTDHNDVLHEAAVLNIDGYFGSKIYGAFDRSEANNKERVIQAIIDDNQIVGHELLVIGDGPVEIYEAKKYKAIALGVASDELNRNGWNMRKVARLKSAMADMLISDFTNSKDLINKYFRTKKSN